MNNPVNMVDSDGCFGLIAAFAAAVVIGVVSGVISGLVASYIKLRPKESAEIVVGQLIPETNAIIKPRNVEKNLDKARRKKEQHSMNVVNTACVGKKGKKLPVISIDTSIFKTDQDYALFCQQQGSLLENYTETVCGFSISGKAWNQLTWDQQQMIINEMPSWSASLSQDIGKQAAKESVVDLLF